VGGTISNCYSIGNVSSEGIEGVYTGGLVGNNGYGKVYNSCSFGNTIGRYYTGGLIGYNTGEVYNSYSVESVSKGYHVGGLIGQNNSGEVINCYSAGSVSGGTYVGGLAGYNDSGLYRKCFWDSNVCPDANGIGNTADANVIGLPTALMQTKSTFTDAGWDFMGETTNGTEDIWIILEGLDYPRLAEQIIFLDELAINSQWMYQNMPSQTTSSLTASISIFDDPMDNNSYTYDWEFILPADVNIAPAIITGGGPNDTSCSFAAPGCNQPNGISDSGLPFKVRVVVTGDDYHNVGIAEKQFGIALLGDVNNDGSVDVADRSIINAFWRTGSAGSFTYRDCNINCDGGIDVADRSIANAIWRGTLGQNSIGDSCPFRESLIATGKRVSETLTEPEHYRARRRPLRKKFLRPARRRKQGR
jgi:hypothetical protein